MSERPWRPGVVLVVLAALAATSHADEAEEQAASLVGESVRLRPVHTVQVLMQPPYYSPAELRIEAGSEVKWINPSVAEAHGVREVGQGAFSLDVPPAGEAIFRFERPGVYPYRCRYHPWMSGQVIVEPRRLAPRPVQVTDFAIAGSHLVPTGEALYLVEGGERQRVAVLADGRARVVSGLSVPIDSSPTGGRLRAEAAGLAPSLRPRSGDHSLVVVSDGAFFVDSDGLRLLHWRSGEPVRSFLLPLPLRGEPALANGRDGELWIADRALGRLERGEVQVLTLDSWSRTRQLAIDQNGDLWLLDNDAGRLASVARSRLLPWEENR